MKKVILMIFQFLTVIADITNKFNISAIAKLAALTMETEDSSENTNVLKVKMAPGRGGTYL